MMTNHLAFIGIGGISSMMTALGCITPNASSSPITAPEAPTSDMGSSPNASAVKYWISAAPMPQTM